MNRHLLRGLLAMYPRTFRDRYGAELARLTDELISAGEITPLLAVLNLAGGAALEWGRVLTGSRRAALAVSAAAVMAAAGSLVVAAVGLFYVAGHAQPPSKAVSVRIVGAPAAIALPAVSCAVKVTPAGQGSVQVIVGIPASKLGQVAVSKPGQVAVSKPGHVAAAVAPVVVLLPGTLSIQSGSLPSQVPVSVRVGSAGQCVIKLSPPPRPVVPKG
jgi:hypothetical protein